MQKKNIYQVTNLGGNMLLNYISQKTGISQPHLSKIFNGDVPPGRGACIKISKITGRPWNEIIVTPGAQIRSELESALSKDAA